MCNVMVICRQIEESCEDLCSVHVFWVFISSDSTGGETKKLMVMALRSKSQIHFVLPTVCFYLYLSSYYVLICPVKAFFCPETWALNVLSFSTVSIHTVMSGKAFHSCCWCVLCSWILHSAFSFLPSWPAVLVLWWSWYNNLSIQAANWDFSTPSILGRGFLCCLLHVQIHKIPYMWLKLHFPSAVVLEPVRVWKPTWGHTNSSFGSVNSYLQKG